MRWSKSYAHTSWSKSYAHTNAHKRTQTNTKYSQTHTQAYTQYDMCLKLDLSYRERLVEGTDGQVLQYQHYRHFSIIHDP